MYKYYEIAEKVLSDSESMLTARQIWDSAGRRGYITDGSFGEYPWLALGRALSREINQKQRSSAIGFSRGKPTSYYLRAVIDTRDLLDEKADALLPLGMAELMRRIKLRMPRPEHKKVTAGVYNRDPNVIAYVRLRADHCCENCGLPGFKKDNGHLYVEVHHIRRLADGGSDIPENAVALCANCHRQFHHSSDRNMLLTTLLTKLTSKGIEVKSQ